MGRVVVSFRLADAGRAREIRVLEMPHPLLGTWAIEAIARAEKKKRLKQDPVIVPKDLYVTTFSFEWRWADDPSGSSDAEEQDVDGWTSELDRQLEVRLVDEVAMGEQPAIE